MDIKIDDEILYTLTDTQLAVYKDYINTDLLDDDLKRRLEWVLMHWLDECVARLKLEWVDGGRLAANGVTMFPLDNMALAELILSQPDYKCRKTRDEETTELQMAGQNIEI